MRFLRMQRTCAIEVASNMLSYLSVNDVVDLSFAGVLAMCLLYLGGALLLFQIHITATKMARDEALQCQFPSFPRLVRQFLSFALVQWCFLPVQHNDSATFADMAPVRSKYVTTL